MKSSIPTLLCVALVTSAITVAHAATMHNATPTPPATPTVSLPSIAPPTVPPSATTTVQPGFNAPSNVSETQQQLINQPQVATASPAIPQDTQNAQQAVNAANNLPPELVKLIHDKNIQLATDIADAQAKEAALAKAKAEAEKKEIELRRIQEEQAKKNIVELEIAPSILYRKPYDHKAPGSTQLYKKRYGANNQHLPVITGPGEYSRYLFAAAVNDNLGAITSLLQKGADINATSMQHGYTPLMYAIKNCKYRAVSYLVTHGADLEVVGLDGKNALIIAAESKDEELYGLLLAAGAKPLPAVVLENAQYNSVLADVMAAVNNWTVDTIMPTIEAIEGTDSGNAMMPTNSASTTPSTSSNPTTVTGQFKKDLAEAWDDMKESGAALCSDIRGWLQNMSRTN